MWKIWLVPPSKSMSIDSISAGVAAAAEAGNRDEEVEQAVGAVACPVDEHEAACTGPGQRALGHPRRERRGDAGVDRVPALGEDPRARLGGQRVAGSDGAPHRGKPRG